MQEKKADFEFDWKFRDFQIRTAHRGMNGSYIELVKWYERPDGRQYCFTLAYWHRTKDGFWELKFVGDRPFEEIAEIDIGTIWKQLWLAQQMFMDAEKKAEVAYD